MYETPLEGSSCRDGGGGWNVYEGWRGTAEGAEINGCMSPRHLRSAGTPQWSCIWAFINSAEVPCEVLSHQDFVIRRKACVRRRPPPGRSSIAVDESCYIVPKLHGKCPDGISTFSSAAFEQWSKACETNIQKRKGGITQRKRRKEMRPSCMIILNDVEEWQDGSGRDIWSLNLYGSVSKRRRVRKFKSIRHEYAQSR